MPPKTTAMSVPFNAGVREDIEGKLLPDGLFTRLQNARYRKDGRLGLRNGYAAIASTTPNGGAGTFKAYDLAEFEGRLVAFGEENSHGFPEHIYSRAGTTAGEWQASLPSMGGVAANGWQSLPPWNGIEEVEFPLSGAVSSSALHRSWCASVDGTVAIVYSDNTSLFFIVIAPDGTIEQSQQLTNSRCLGVCTPTSGASRVFIFLVCDASDDLIAYRVTPGQGTFNLLGTIDNRAATFGGVAAICAVDGLDQFCTAIDRNSDDLQVKRYSIAFAQQGSTITLASTAPTHISVTADGTGSGAISISHLTDSTDTLTLYTWTFAGALTGPTTVSSSATSTEAYVVRLPANATYSFAESLAIVYGRLDSSVGYATGGFLSTNVRTRSTHASVITRNIGNLVLCGPPIAATSPSYTQAVFVVGTVADTLDLTSQFRTSALALHVPAPSSAAGGAHLVTLDPLTALHGKACLARDGVSGDMVWLRNVQSPDGARGIRVARVTALSAARRQTAKQNASLLIAGGHLSSFDGSLPEVVNFPEVPGIRLSTLSNSTGLLTNSGQYDYVATWSLQLHGEDIVISAPSNPLSVTLGASDDTVQLDITSPIINRLKVGAVYAGVTLAITLWRTVWDGTAKITGYRKTAVLSTAASTAPLGGNWTVTDLRSDTDLADEALLYTDAGSGALSGALPRFASVPAEYVWATPSGAILAGLPRRGGFQESLPLSPGEALTFCPNALTGVSFFGTCDGKVEAVAMVDGVRVMFQRDRIMVSAGDSPDSEGSRPIPTPVELPTDFGIVEDGWRSLLLTKEGLWFQADREKLCRIPRGAGVPTWEGQAIRSTLALYPDIVAAALASDDSIAVFAANDNDSGILIVRAQRLGDWGIDTLPGTGLVRSVAAVGGKLYAIVGTTVYEQTDGFDDGTGALIPLVAELGSATAFGIAGWGKIACVTLLAEYRGNCTVRGYISYDDGQSFTLMKEFDLEDLVVGSTKELQFWPRRRKCSRFRLKFELIDLDGPSEGAVLHGVTLHVRSSGAPTKKEAAARG